MNDERGRELSGLQRRCTEAALRVGPPLGIHGHDSLISSAKPHQQDCSQPGYSGSATSESNERGRSN